MVARLQLYGITITRSIFSQIECGTNNIKVSELLAISKILRVEIGELFEGIDLPG